MNTTGFAASRPWRSAIPIGHGLYAPGCAGGYSATALTPGRSYHPLIRAFFPNPCVCLPGARLRKVMKKVQ